jgi:hypothetical protein
VGEYHSCAGSSTVTSAPMLLATSHVMPLAQVSLEKTLGQLLVATELEQATLPRLQQLGISTPAGSTFKPTTTSLERTTRISRSCLWSSRTTRSQSPATNLGPLYPAKGPHQLLQRTSRCSEVSPQACGLEPLPLCWDQLKEPPAATWPAAPTPVGASDSFHTTAVSLLCLVPFRQPRTPETSVATASALDTHTQLRIARRRRRSRHTTALRTLPSPDQPLQHSFNMRIRLPFAGT